MLYPAPQRVRSNVSRSVCGDLIRFNMGKYPATKEEFILNQEQRVQAIREKILKEFHSLDYVKMNSLMQQCKRRLNLIAMAKAGILKDFFIYSS